MNFADKLRRLRAGRSPEWVGQQVKCAGGSIRRMETNDQEPKIRLAFALATLFKVPLDWLVDDSLDWPPPASEGSNIITMVRDAMLRDGRLGALSADETAIIAAVRQLPPDLIRQAVGYVQGLTVQREVTPAGGTSRSDIETMGRKFDRQDPDESGRGARPQSGEDRSSSVG